MSLTILQDDLVPSQDYQVRVRSLVAPGHESSYGGIPSDWTDPVDWTSNEGTLHQQREYKTDSEESARFIQMSTTWALNPSHTHIMNVGNHNHVHHLFCFLSTGSLLVHQHPDLFLHRCAGGHSLPHTLLHHSCLPEVRDSCSFISLYVSENGT